VIAWTIAVVTHVSLSSLSHDVEPQTSLDLPSWIRELHSLHLT